MAIANTVATLPTFSPDVLTQIQQARVDVKSAFQQLAAALRDRERCLLDQLSEIEDNIRSKLTNQRQMIASLEANRAHCIEDLQNDSLKDFLMAMVAEIDSKLREIRNLAIDHVEFSFSEYLISSVSEFGRIDSFQVVPKVLANYRAKIDPVFQGSIKGKIKGNIQNPYVIALDPKTGNMYVADFGNGGISVFTSKAEYLFTFGERGEGRIRLPGSIVISENKVYVTLMSGNCINVYKLNGTFLSRFGGKEGNGKLYFPWGLAISAKGNFYVSDSNNNRIVVFDKNFNFNTEFTDEELKRPTDIQLSRLHILVLGFHNNPLTFFRFNHDHELVDKLLVPWGNGRCFCIDTNSNLIMPDSGNNCVYILSTNGTLIHQIGRGKSALFDRPQCVAIDHMDRIIVVDNKKENCIQFF